MRGAIASLPEVEIRHRWMLAARVAGLAFVPALLPTRQGTTAIGDAGWVWEMQQWLPGVADFHARPSAAKLRAACLALAQLHTVWQREATEPTLGPALLRRLAELPADEELRDYASRSFVLQPCLVDIGHDHVLFQEDQVSGIVDYATMRLDLPHADLARLLGSLVEDDEAGWDVGLEAYARLRPVPDVRLIRLLDRTGTQIALTRWERWQAEGRVVSPRARARLERLRQRVARWKQERPRLYGGEAVR